MSILRNRIETLIHQTTGLGLGGIDYDQPAGDPGLYGPGSVVWRVHADFTAMMIGGMSALFLQMLHPLALAGVWDHSNFRQDMLGRLRRTARFVAGTTYGSRGDALRLVAHVRAIHDGVHGVAPDGRAYSANAPDLLTWVHAAEATGFLAAHRRYKNSALNDADEDRYYAESTRVPVLLGAVSVPASRAEMDAFFDGVRPELRCDDRTRTARDALLSAVDDAGPLQRTVGRLMLGAAIGLLPPWATDMLEFRRVRGCPRRHDPSVNAVARLLRWAVRDGSAHRARRRVGQHERQQGIS